MSTSHELRGATCRRLNLSSFSSPGVIKSGAISGEVDDKLRVEDHVNEFEDDFVFDDDASNDGNVDDKDSSESEEEECQADHSVFDLYEKMFKLQSNPLGLEQFSREEKVQIEFITTLKGSELSSKSIYPSTELGSKINSKWPCIPDGLSTNS